MGRIADETGLTVQETREAFALYDARLRPEVADTSLHAIEARFVAAETSGRLAQSVRDTVVSNRPRAVVPRRKAA